MRSDSARRRVNPIDVIEAAYNLHHDDRTWLHQIAATLQPLLEGGYGVWGYYFDPIRSAAQWLDTLVTVGARRTEIAHAKRMSLASQDRIVENTHVVIEPLQSALEAQRAANLGARAAAHYQAFLTKIGASDYLAFRTVEPGGSGIAIAAAQRTAWSPDRKTRALWARVAGHVAAARRLRAALAAAPERAAVDAVLTPGGRLDHAESSVAVNAAEALRAAVLDQERARSSLRRRDPEGATEGWQALVRGQWSLLDRFERGGRRYIVAYRNPPELAVQRALTARESVVVHLAALGKSNKLIAYELGLSESGVSSHLHAAMRKLGITSRSEVIRLAAFLEGGPTKTR